MILTAFLHANEGPVSAKSVVSNKSILSGNVVELHIRATGKLAVFPVVKNIDGVKVLSSDERITNMHVYNNGKLQRECTILTLRFAPKKDMTIPSFEVKIDGRFYKTEPIKLKMKDSTTSNQNKSDIFSLRLGSNKKSVAVGEAFLATVTLSLQNDFIISKKIQYHRPKFEGFFVEQLDKGKSYEKNEHQITVFRYILTPHSEGNYTLGPAYAKIGLRNRGKNADKSRKIFQRASNTVELEVLPQTTKSDLVGTFNLKSKVKMQKVTAGKPVRLNIRLEGEGDLTRFEFPDYTLDGVTIYTDEAKIEITETEGKVYSSYSKEFVFISDENFTIPEQAFTVYDPKTDLLKTLKIEKIDIEVNRSAVVAGNAKKANASKPGKTMVERVIALKTKLQAIPRDWWFTLLAFVVGGIFFYLLRYLPERKRRSFNELEALKILLPHTSKDPEVEKTVEKLYAKINGNASVVIDKKRLKTLVERYR